MNKDSCPTCHDLCAPLPFYNQILLINAPLPIPPSVLKFKKRCLLPQEKAPFSIRNQLGVIRCNRNTPF